MYRMLMIATVLSLLASPGLAAEPTLCTSRIDGKDVPMAYDKDEDISRQNYSLREVLFTRRGRDTCPSYVVLRSLTPDLTDEQRRPFCLRHDAEADSIIGYDLGRRDAYGRCRAPSGSLCRRINQTKGAAGQISGAAAGGAVRGLRALPDGSGAIILEGSRSHISSALGAIGGAAASLAASPVLLTGAAVTVLTVGGAVYACRED
ncbi:hypothetical protein [Paracoccus salsus]|uniref:hypothetical protein n=1 Tax=Paracoccus salsus TaxID=2911061 RepID=UPI001F1A159C|nr:hypothetical protein [Paracoccus salsus]